MGLNERCSLLNRLKPNIRCSSLLGVKEGLDEKPSSPPNKKSEDRPFSNSISEAALLEVPLSAISAAIRCRNREICSSLTPRARANARACSSLIPRFCISVVSCIICPSLKAETSTAAGFIFCAVAKEKHKNNMKLKSQNILIVKQLKNHTQYFEKQKQYYVNKSEPPINSYTLLQQ